MARKPPPKYPHRGRLIRRRLLSQALLLLCAAGVITFYYYIKYTDPDQSGTLYRLGESIGMAGKSPPPPAPSSSSPVPTGQTPSAPPVSPDTENARPGSRTAAVAPEPSRTSGQPEPEKSEAGTPPSSAAKKPLPRENASGTLPSSVDTNDLPFSGLSLREVAASPQKKYAGTPAGQWGERVAGVVTRLDAEAADASPSGAAQSSAPLVIALTFDACGGGKDGYDAELIAFLRERRIPATLFVTSLWMRRHPETLRELAADPLFEIAAHGERHLPCSVNGKSAYGIKGTASMPELVREVLGNARDIREATGRAPHWFRSGTAFYDQLAVKVIHDLGMAVAGYSIAGDQGATLPPARVAAQALKARHGDILLFHMNKPRSGTREGLRKALPLLLEKGATFVRLSDSL